MLVRLWPSVSVSLGCTYISPRMRELIHVEIEKPIELQSFHGSIQSAKKLLVTHKGPIRKESLIISFMKGRYSSDDFIL
jgi:hypothetical protein